MVRGIFACPIGDESFRHKCGCFDQASLVGLRHCGERAGLTELDPLPRRDEVDDFFSSKSHIQDTPYSTSSTSQCIRQCCSEHHFALAQSNTEPGWRYCRILLPDQRIRWIVVSSPDSSLFSVLLLLLREGGMSDYVPRVSDATTWGCVHITGGWAT
jgi:hypothetical protein